MEPSPTDLYSIKECVGRGNFGDVYKAVDNRTRKLVAIKVVNLEYTDEDISLLAQEIFFLAELKCPYITNYLTTIVEDVSMWIVMEYCGGGSCADLIKYCYKTGLPEIKVSFIIKNVLLGLQYLHDQKKIHRDIKAANILLTDSGQIKLGDFGVSGKMTATLKRDTFVGTPYWMAPEVISREINDGYDEKADIWSLGITTYELLKGLPPLSKYEPMKVIANLVKRKSPKLHGMFNPFTKNFIAKCLIKDPHERPGTTALLESEFILFYKDHIKDIKDDVDICKNIKARDRNYFNRQPKFSINDKFYNTLCQIDEPIWDFNSMRAGPVIDSAISSDTSNSNHNWSPITDNMKNETITPITMESDTQRSFKKLKQYNPYELGSGMDIDSDKNPEDEPCNLKPVNKENELTNIDYFKNVISYCLGRMSERAKDVETRQRVIHLLQQFSETESNVPGLSEVFMEEVMLRMDRINTYLTNK
ncbi:similar to Saccharomyces cerevisiae YDR523C SPS1 Putative protein serine/threonine kinase expressed at the end of meiosis and localized to the prospore membrane [Maudiozyma saulgeensis]|uniref:non-specific serine/threonine protein kinase n=1 Tax=Maudiozyma saulgeensis TaxID=1789683 RepID=A0A1X7R721_9SACH|nr:similar to Saccharomyces cerevisiae YDR523C SPS1 Putative protein serine/threonine kinase expressed at the end of meiosis and localized to the prospore membrane [Kazachstania saulgeensis]